jgi:Flp pilus assembly protein TadG
MKTQEQKKARGQRGQALAEFSLILPILLLVVFGIIDFGRVLFVFADASGKLRDAARYAAVLGLSSDSTPEFVNCTDIRNTALSTMFVSNEAVQVYYWDTTDPADSGLIPLDPNPALYANHAAYLATAHYTCATVSASGSELESGDIMRVHYTGRINFITPFLSAIWTGIDMDFFAQRSIIDQLILGSTDGIDYDFDGLDDRWEFMWYGCYDENDNLWLVDEEWLYADLSTWREWTLSPDPILNPGAGPSNQRWYIEGLEDDEQLCDGIRWVTNPDDPDGDDVPIPLASNLEATNAIRDFDGDGCSAGCEENRNSNPEDGDSDSDGLDDGEEATTYFTNPTGGDFYYCHENQRHDAPNGDGVPDGYDSDCDGVPDGVEVGVFEPNNPNWPYDGAPPAEFGYPYRPSYAFMSDNDVDGYFDSVDSDGDELYDYTEYYGADPCFGEEAAGRPLQGTPYDCHPDLRLPEYAFISFPTNEYLTSSTYYDDSAPAGPDGYDTDNDGMSDKEEIDGWDAGSFERNREMLYDVHYTSHPNYNDSDLIGSDHLGDDESVAVDDIPTLDINERDHPISTTDGGVGKTDPMNPDSDFDGLSDWEELNAEFPSNPLDDDSDFDGLSDSDEPNVYSTDSGNPNSDGTPLTGYDYDGDGLPDDGFYVDSAGETYPDDPHFKNYAVIAGHDYSGNAAYANVALPGEVLNTVDACKYMNDGYEVNFLFTDPNDLDSDNDGLSDCYEVDNNLDPNDEDVDGDGILDGIDCEWRVSSSQSIVDGCNINDVDNDGMDDQWEIDNLGGDGEPDLDYDNDGCDNLCEYQRGTDTSPLDEINCGLVPGTNNRYDDNNPLRNGPDGIIDGWDTDCDGIFDNDELPDSSPTEHDTDTDGLIDGFEMNYTYNGLLSPLNPRSPNSDGDDISDYNEVFSYVGVCANGMGLNPAAGDTDGDGLADHLEANATAAAYDAIFPDATEYPFRNAGTDPCNQNTDGDGWTDTEEIFSYTGANPRNIDTDGDGIQDDVENDVTGTIYTIYNTRTCNGDGTFTNGANPNGRANGYDTDCDGLRDGIEVYNLAYADLVGGGALDGFTMDIYICDSVTPTQNDILISLLNPNNPNSDNDGLSDGEEWNPEANGGAGAGVGTNPQIANTDNDLASDGAEENDGDAATDPLCGDGVADNDDRDNDTLLNDAEITGFNLGGIIGHVVTDPDNADSDGDLIPDNEEIDGRAFEYTYIDTAGNEQTVTYTAVDPLITNPTHIDSTTDSDNLDDGWDSDRDGINDFDEFAGIALNDPDYDVFFVDCDRDDTADTGITYPMLINPVDYDTDGDGMPDGTEIELDMNPLDGTCGPEIIYAKVGPDLETGIQMNWLVPGSGTEGLSDRGAEEQAMLYIDTYYVTNLGSDGAGVFPATMTMTVGFVGSQRCNPQGGIGEDTLRAIIQAEGGTNIASNGSDIDNTWCMLTATVTFDQMIAIGIDPYITQIVDHVTELQQ